MKPWTVRAFAPAAGLCLAIAAACGGDRDKFGDGFTSILDAGVDAGSDAGLDAGSDAGVDAGSDAGVEAGSDAGSDGGVAADGPDAGNGSCTADLDYGTVSPFSQVAVHHAHPSGSEPDYEYQGQLNQDALYDYLDLQLYAGQGIFTNQPIQPGTYVLGGGDLSYATCGLCVLVNTNTDANGKPTDYYLATSGTVTLTSLSGQISGSLSDVDFAHVDISQGASTPDPDGCTSRIDVMQFSAQTQ